ncbi:protein of unknown function [Cupriavidus taiwanensis]|nr:protein of unknown function [Cupriavidus taiwanensis]
MMGEENYWTVMRLRKAGRELGA